MNGIEANSRNAKAALVGAAFGGGLVDAVRVAGWGGVGKWFFAQRRKVRKDLALAAQPPSLRSGRLA
jgi:hypothetical protein